MPLFGHEPTAADVRQGDVGDCWFLAGLASVAAKHPDIIKNSFRDHGDGTVIVRLYSNKYTKKKNTLPHDEIQKRLNNILLWVRENIEKDIYSVDKMDKRVNKQTDGQDSKDLMNVLNGFAHLKVNSKSFDNCNINIDLLYEETIDMFSEVWEAAENAKFPGLKIYFELIKFFDFAFQEAPDTRHTLVGNGSGTTPMYYKVKKSIAIGNQGKTKSVIGADDSALWVLMLEKALVMHAQGGDKDKGFDYFNIEGAVDKVLSSKTCRHALAEQLLSGKIFFEKDFNDFNLSDNFNLSECLSYGKYFKDKKEMKNFDKQIEDKGMEMRAKGQVLDIDTLKQFILKDAKIDGPKHADTKQKQQSNRQNLCKEMMQELLNSNRRYVLNYKPFSGKYAKKANQVYNNIKITMEKGETMFAYSANSTKDKNGKNGESMRNGIAGSHAYSVLGTLEEIKDNKEIRYVILRNPWGECTRKYGKANKPSETREDNHGVAKIELNDFMNEFCCISEKLEFNFSSTIKLPDKDRFKTLVEKYKEPEKAEPKQNNNKIDKDE